MIETDAMSYRRRKSCRVAWQALWLLVFGCAAPTDAQERGRPAPWTGDVLEAGDHARTPPLPRPLALWSFEACGKSPIADDSRHGHFATGTMACVPGRIGSGAGFDAARTGLWVAESPRFRARAALSIVTWIKVGQNLPAQVALARPATWAISHQDQQIACSVWFDGGAEGRLFRATAAFEPSRWVHVGCVFDGANLSLYLDGWLAARETAVGLLRSSTGSIAIGDHFAGSLDEVAIYNHPLSDAEIALLAKRAVNDLDRDRVADDVDNCHRVANTGQSDQDGDGTGDDCDRCPQDPARDLAGGCAVASCAGSCNRFLSCVAAGGSAADCAEPCAPGGNPCETAPEASARHARVAARRAGRLVFAHRGSMEIAAQNTLEAYRTTLELGGDGNELDVRRTTDGVLVCFHDDMLDGLVDAFGDVSDYTWQELQRFAFRTPQLYGASARIPSLAEVLDLHRQLDGLLVFDFKVPGLGPDVAALVEALDMWDHIAGGADPAISGHPGFVPGPPMLGLFDKRDVDPVALADAVASSAGAFMTDDPRGILRALGRPLGPLTPTPHRSPQRVPAYRASPPVVDLVAVLAGDTDSTTLHSDAAGRASAGANITTRAIAASLLRTDGDRSASVLEALRGRALARSLHQDWRYMGLDGQYALSASIASGDPLAIDLVRTVIHRVDPVLETVKAAIAAIDPDDPFASLPAVRLDWREKWNVWAGLDSHPARAEVVPIAREFLRLDDAGMSAIGYHPIVVEWVASVLVRAAADTSTAVELLGDARQTVRGRVLLDLLSLAREHEWARQALVQAAPYALEWLVVLREG
jgi:hypothetical protein